MKIKLSIKRAVSLIIALSTVVTSFVISPTEAYAATVSAVTFIDNIKGTKSRDATLLEGETIKVDIVRPDNYVLQGTQPYELISDPPVSPADYPFTTSPEGNITAKLGATTTMQQYTIRPLFSAFLTESDTGLAELKVQDPADPDNPAATVDKKVAISATVVGSTDVSITKTSTISFGVISDQTDENGYIDFGTATATDDLAGDFNNATVSYKGREGEKVIVQITNVSGRKLDLAITCPALPSLIKAGSKFSLTFAMQTINTLQLTIITRQHAVNVIAADIAATANFADFVKLASGDSSNKIKQKFQLVHKEQRYNYKKGFNIEWKWKPDTSNAVNDGVLTITGSPTDMSYLASPRQILEDVPGRLEAAISFTSDDGGTTVKAENPPGTDYFPTIPITILGTGLMPSFVPLYSYTGKQDAAGDQVIDQVRILDIPSDLDVNDGLSKNFPGTKPYEFTAELKYGTGLGRAKDIKFTLDPTQNGMVEIFTDNLSTPYVPGTLLPIPTESSGEVTRNIKIRATAEGLARMRIYYYNDSGKEYNGSPRTFNFNIVDTSPGRDASFKFLKLEGVPEAISDGGTPADPSDDIDYPARFAELYPDGVINFDYSPDNETYDTITVPYAVKEVKVTPTYNDIALKTADYHYKFNGSLSTAVESGKSTVAIPLSTEEPTVIYINGTAQDGKELSSYRLTIKRNPQSSVASLKSMTLKTLKDSKEHPFTPEFGTESYNYTLTLPFHYANITQLSDGNLVTNPASTELSAIATGDWGAKPKFEDITAGIVSPLSLFERIFQNKNTTKLNLRYEIDPVTEAVTNKNSIKISAQSEDRKQDADYFLDIFIEDPSDNDKLSELKVSTQTKSGVVDLPYYQSKPFDKGQYEYYVDIKYLHDNVRFEFLPDDLKAQKIRITDPSGAVKELDYRGTTDLILRKYDTKNDVADYMNEFTFKFEVQAENGKWSANPYFVHFTRAPASSDSRLKTLDVTDAGTNTPVSEFAFIQTKTDYTFNVPFTTEIVSITPTANAPEFSTITVDGKEINVGRPSREVELEAGKQHKIQIVVTPESGDADKTVYTLNITREKPSTEARLKNLEVGGGENMKPKPFVPSTLGYSVEIPEGTATYTITATPYDEHATVTVNGKSVANGAASEAITSLTADSTVTVVVTAQDGKTTKTYTIKVRDYNLVTKSNKAELSDLKVHYADLSPYFKSGVTSYEVFLKPEADILEFTPTASSRATVVVKADDRELKAYGGIYSTSVHEDSMEVSVEVTAEDGKAKNTYTLTVFRNDKKKQGSFKPITSTMVDYGVADPIIIDIRNYAIIDASVFNTLKTEYPDKSILFTGNDYSLRIKGSDIKNLVPHTTQYDLFFSFSSPDEEIVDDILWNSDNPKDSDIEPVYVYFNDHGDLPAKMVLTLSLGGAYKNSQLFWNYYNDDRVRIDYYGYVNSNAKGTISVPITHFSTYMVTKRKIFASEDKTSMNFGSMDGVTGGSTGSSGSGSSDDKEVPKTSVE